MKSYTYNGTEYVFRLSRKAKVEIEEINNRELDKFQKLDPETFELAMSLEEGMDLSNIEKDKLEKVIALLPKLKELQVTGGTDIYEIGYVLLKNNKRYQDTMTRELFDEIVDDMEEKLGFEETSDFFMEISDTVFTVIEKIQDRQTKLRLKN